MNNHRFTRGKITLKEHLEILDQNAAVSIEDVNRLLRRVRFVFQNCGYQRASMSDRILQEYIILIFSAQDFRCTHWLPTTGDELNGIWNNPGTEYSKWKTSRISYEVDHVRPMNCGGIDELTNIQFLSPNSNRFIKNALTYESLLRRVDLSDIFKERIRKVLMQRQQLFESEKWMLFIEKIEAIERGDSYWKWNAHAAKKLNNQENILEVY